MSDGIIQRAFALAASGSFRNVGEIEKALRGEGFAQVADHLSSRSLRTQLKALMARGAATDAPAAR